MNHPVSTLFFVVSILLCIPSSHHIAEAGNFTASTISNAFLINGLEVPNLHPNINTTETIVTKQVASHRQHPHHCHHGSHHKNDSIISNHDHNRTLLPSNNHRPDDTKQEQFETATFIAAEKGLPHKGILMSNGNMNVKKSNINMKPEGNLSTVSQPEQVTESTKNRSNFTANLEDISNHTVSNSRNVVSWIKSPLFQNMLKYMVSEFYPEKILNSLSNRLSFSNQSKIGVTVNPSVVYPLLMEGVSVLANRFAANESHEGASGVTQGVIKGKMANVMINSLEKLLKNKVVGSPLQDSRSAPSTSENPTGIDGMVNFDVVKSLLPLIQKVQNNGGVSDIILKLLNSTSNGLGDLDLNEILKNYGSQLDGISSNARIVSAIVKQSSTNRSHALNLTSIMEQFMPKHPNGVEDSLSPKDPLLRSEFASKVLSKSPVAHLGALDDNIKKLLTSSLERAVSRVKMDQNGQIQMSDGMRKMFNKMLQDSKSNVTATSTLDSINGVLKTVAQMSSAPMNVSEEPQKSRRNVTKHSHLHRRFQEKYGKDPRVLNSSPSISSSRYLVLLIPFAASYLQTQ